MKAVAGHSDAHYVIVDHRGPWRAFSIIELMMVMAIAALLVAVAIPRLSRGAEGASENALERDLVTLRGAIDRYAAEHFGTWPTWLDIEDQLTMSTDLDGNTSPAMDTTHVFGPYLASIPPVPCGRWKGSDRIKKAPVVPPIAVIGSAGWQYDQGTGQIWANSADHLGL
ncbi:MAG: prepilin-type N-terminal cleavage/methylation domain-containing protein [Phycisphaerales bacterium]|nr:prepilin-type N-terminal cleavage/methylation domain-containing protein [Phycisphaerales bacterium]